MSGNTYEGMFILDPNRCARDLHGVSGQVVETIRKAGGEILVSRLWEERKLAYPIKGHRRGTYWLTYFKVAPAQLRGLIRQFEINENVLRSLILKVDPRIADALVRHALAAGREETTRGEQEAGKEPESLERAPAGGSEPAEIVV